MKTILFSGNSAWSMYNFRRQIFEYFVKQGLRVCVVSPFDEEFTPKIEALGCEFIALEMEAKGVNPIKDFGVYTSYRKIMRSIKPDFCFFYTIKPNIYGSFAATSLNIPHIAITTGLGYTFINNNIVSFVAKKLYKLAFRKTKQVWFLNKDDEKAFLAEKIINKNKAYVMQGGEGVDLTRFEKTTLPTDVSFLLLARMLWDKGIGEYVEAARIIKAKYSNVRFKLLGFVGVDNPSAIAKTQIDEWVKEGVVEYLGVTNDVRPFIADSTCVVLPSYREGVPVSLLEGASMYRPIITSESVGCKETVDDKLSGFLCQAKDVDSLVKVMENLLCLPYNEQVVMGEKGREKMEREFDLNLVISQYKKIISQ